jgi:hypothetical protein
VAVRHAEDHIHLVVMLARQDGAPARTSNDFYRVGEACRAAETRLGLTGTAARDRTAARRPTRGETEKAKRAGRREPARVTLQREVRTAAAGAATAEEFLSRLADAGLLVRSRLSEKNPSVITGYAVGLARPAGGLYASHRAPVQELPPIRTGRPYPYSRAHPAWCSASSPTWPMR